MIFGIILYIVSIVYFVILLATFIGTFSRKTETVGHSKSTSASTVSVIVLIRQPEDLKIENIRKILDQTYAGAPVEYIIIDQTGRLEIKNGDSALFYQKKILSLHVKSLSWQTLVDIISLKASGEKVLFIRGRSRVSEKWIEGFMEDFADGSPVVMSRTLVDTDTPRPRHVQAIDQLYRATLAKGFSRLGYMPVISMNNIGISRGELARPAKSFSEWIAGAIQDSGGNIKCAVSPDTGCINDPADRFADFMSNRRQECGWTYSVFLKTVPGAIFLGFQLLISLLPVIYFFVFLAGAASIFPLVAAFFAKFISEGMIVSRGARLHSQQDLLNDFWSWFIMNPIITLIITVWIFLPGKNTAEL